MSSTFTWSARPLGVEDEKLVAAYEKIGRPLDTLPFTDDFDELLRQVEKDPNDAARSEVLHRLLRLRKSGRLPRANTISGIAEEKAPLSLEDQELISAYQRIGRSLDFLPYSEDFDRLMDELGKPKTPVLKHAVFQRLLGLRKRGRLPHAAEQTR